MLSVQHGHYVKSLYKRLLSEAGVFFDSRARYATLFLKMKSLQCPEAAKSRLEHLWSIV
jgi:hypothetical protein